MQRKTTITYGQISELGDILRMCKYRILATGALTDKDLTPDQLMLDDVAQRLKKLLDKIDPTWDAD